jgi:hypothetical protein
MPTRTELIADWKRQLAAAQALPQASLRAAWLTRVRARLYRFLVACYGNGDWTTDYALSSPARAVADRPQADTSCSPAALSDLSGKPAKSAGHIRSVLKKVAGAQEAAIGVGPLAAGLDPAGWVIVAAAS